MIFVVCTEPVCLFVGLLYWEGFWRERELDLAQDRGQISQHAVRPSHWLVCLCVVARGSVNLANAYVLCDSPFDTDECV